MYSYLLGHSNLTPFQKEVLINLDKVPCGETVTYGQLAKMINRPSASRAVGNALNRNPYPVIIPCHRVVGKNSIGGYGRGLEMKRFLLAIESIAKFF